MDIDLDTTTAFMTAHARVLDRHRFARLLGETDGARLLGAAEAYRNPDGGYGWGLEPDLRSVTSQPGGALHALEAFADAAPATTPRAAELCDWLDGPLPRRRPAVRVADPGPGRPARRSGLGAIRASPRCRSRRRSPARPTASPHRPGCRRPSVAGAGDGVLPRRIDALDGPPHALVLRFAFELLGADGR